VSASGNHAYSCSRSDAVFCQILQLWVENKGVAKLGIWEGLLLWVGWDLLQNSLHEHVQTSCQIRWQQIRLLMHRYCGAKEATPSGLRVCLTSGMKCYCWCGRAETATSCIPRWWIGKWPLEVASRGKLRKKRVILWNKKPRINPQQCPVSFSFVGVHGTKSTSTSISSKFISITLNYDEHKKTVRQTMTCRSMKSVE